MVNDGIIHDKDIGKTSYGIITAMLLSPVEIRSWFDNNC